MSAVEESEGASCARCGQGIHVRALCVWEQGVDLCWECQSKRIQELQAEVARLKRFELAQECELRLAATGFVASARHAHRTHSCGSRCIWLRMGLDEYDTRIKEIAARFAVKEQRR